MRKISFGILLKCHLAMTLYAQDAVTVPFTSTRWNTTNAEFIPANFQGKEAILLTGGVFYLDDVQFLNGIIEVDINFSNRRNFPGIRFRMQDLANYENFYIRPHQSGNPDANQYTPVFNGTAGWQLYYGENWATPVTYEYDRWHHIKIDVSGGKADIFFDDMEKPILKVDLLREIKPGMLGISTFLAPVYFANYQYTLTDDPTGAEPVARRQGAATVTRWQVSNVISDEAMMDMLTISEDLKNGLEWKAYESEASGLINLARYSQRSQGNSTVVVKVEIDSENSQLKRLDFGFSDKVRVYLNDQAIFEGDDRFLSRDYRFLGTVGFFDTVFLPLNEGRNELLFVVTEAFGGWGLQARFDNLNGISLP